MEILKLIRQYVYIPVLTDSNVVNTDINFQFGIPPTGGFLSLVLLNYALIDFDESFLSKFPSLKFLRYLNEVLVFFNPPSSNEGMTFQNFEEEVVSLLAKKNLYGKIMSIGPGEGPMKCDNCLVSVSEEGKIEVKEKNDIIDYDV